jgi:hypothetical protein
VNDAAQWSTLVTALTLPVLAPPRFVSLGLSSAVIEWSSYFAPSKLDKTPFGFTLEVCEAGNKSACVQQGFERAALAEQVAAKDVDALIFHTELTTFLAPGQAYIARVKMYFGVSVGHPSDWSFVGSTQALTPPGRVGEPVTAEGAEAGAGGAAIGTNRVLVSFRLPASDGGVPITRYSVFAAEVDTRHSFGAPRLVGGFSPVEVAGAAVGGIAKLEVGHLLPGTKYVFTVSAENEIGTGPSTSPSNQVETPWLRDTSSAAPLIRGESSRERALAPGSAGCPLPADAEGWSPAGRLLAARSAEGELQLYDEVGALCTTRAARAV